VVSPAEAGQVNALLPENRGRPRSFSRRWAQKPGLPQALDPIGRGIRPCSGGFR